MPTTRKKKELEVVINNGRLNISFPLKTGEKRVCEDKFASATFRTQLLIAFSEYLIGALSRRMEACKRNLLAHISEICWVSDGGYHIEWPTGYFNTISYSTMEDGIEILKNLDEDIEVLNNTLLVDQIIKAICNDTEAHPDRVGEFKFSQLITILLGYAQMPQYQTTPCLR